MKNIEVPVSSIGHGTVSPEEREWRRYERETLLRIGLKPRYYDCNTSINNDSNKRLNSKRFSTNYTTRKEFDNDRGIIIDGIINKQRVPEELIRKVEETVEELKLDFADI